MIKSRIYRIWLERQYAKFGLQKGKLGIGSGSECLAFFDSKSPRSGKPPGPPILLLHGFTADKETWLRMVRFLGKDHRVIAVDLAGHGGSSEAGDGDYGFARQAQRAHQLAKELELGRYHVLGHSMGGAVAMALAAMNPAEVLSLGLIAAAGAQGQDTEEFSEYMENGINPLIVASHWSAFEKIAYVTNGPRRLHFRSRLFNSFLTRREIEREQIYREIFGKIGGHLSSKDLQGISQPTFILWGQGDRVLRPSCADHYKSWIPNVLVVEKWDGVGHMPGLEVPRESATAYLAFLEDSGSL